MRPLVRSTLWLGVAVACGIAGLWFGYQRGVTDGAEVIADLQASNSSRESLGRISMALDVLDQGPSRYADSNLRGALFELGSDANLLGGWWSCYPRDVDALQRAAAYLKAHPIPPNALNDPYVARALSICAKAPAEPGRPFRI